MTTPHTQQAYVVAQGTSPINNVIPEPRDPTSYDTDYVLYRLWLNTSTKALWILVGFTSFNGLLQAIWEPLTHGSSGDVAFLQGNTGGPVAPDSGGIINTIGDGTTINVAGNPGTHTLTISGVGNLRSIGVQTTTGGGTNPVLPDGTGKIEIDGATAAAGTHPIQSVSTAANTLQIQAQLSQALAAADSTKVGLANFSSLDFTVDSSGFVQLANASSPSEINLGISYSGSVFSITGQNGNALSSSNPAYVTIASKATPGTFVTITVTANQTFTDSTGSSTIIGNTFGTTSSLAYASDIPFFIYAVLNNAQNAVSFMISRVPHATIAPPSSNIAKTGSAVASTQGSFFALSNPTVTDYQNNPCVCVGAFRMRKNNSDDWAVQALSNGTGFNATVYIGADGIGQFHDESKFILLTGQFGAATGSLFQNNGGTAPIFVNTSADYYVSRSGKLLINYGMGNTTGGGGSGAVGANFSLPFTSQDGTYAAQSSYLVIGGGATQYMLSNILVGGSLNCSFLSSSIPGSLLLSSFSANANTAFYGSVFYQIDYQ